jgi:hypothetical protein
MRFDLFSFLEEKNGYNENDVIKKKIKGLKECKDLMIHFSDVGQFI